MLFNFFSFYFWDCHLITLFLFFPSSLQILPHTLSSSPSNVWPLFSLIIIVYTYAFVHTYIHILINITSWIHILLLQCYLYVCFQGNQLALDKQLACSSLGKAASAPGFPQSPAVLGVELKPCGLSLSSLLCSLVSFLFSSRLCGPAGETLWVQLLMSLGDTTSQRSPWSLALQSGHLSSAMSPEPRCGSVLQMCLLGLGSAVGLVVGEDSPLQSPEIVYCLSE